ncbi:hypothetical protein AMC99_00898 [Altererythrobacter epoxidivorans]|uniref:Uncharacterized protein n=1 Tax=Altererythrobacter epoxidivorans TaxID=361183 RepID=A0A0M4M712_9SPHN|nr:YdeI/OmpD-associated family protein [Altererythrobacter epoxidivorans]ALE16201.1 hypothetical protein AMC99_00898 [Altererythrobacter epoxidivorans]
MTEAADPDFRHSTPPEIEDLLANVPGLQSRWDKLTELGRNEYICWTISAKQEATREKRRQRMVEEVLDGKKRPCCWPGCPHRRESARKFVDA